jgi:D-glycerate 3-kinase
MVEVMLSDFIEQHNLHEDFKLTVKEYYQPFADELFKRFSETKTPYFVGINGCQGSGKSTLTDFIATYLTTQYQINVVVMSLDDFYFSSKKRNALAQDIHPLLSTRGVPGTHDVIELNHVLTQLKQKNTGFSIPKFNKATDEPFCEVEWEIIEQPADIIIVEGWCWGVQPQTEDQLAAPINELECQYDKTGVWRNYVNRQLKIAYEPLYKKMDFWLALQAPSFDCVYKWRLEQEQKLKDRNIDLENSKIMTPTEILNFTQYFQRLSIQACKNFAQSSDATFYLGSDRKITNISIKASV